MDGFGRRLMIQGVQEELRQMAATNLAHDDNVKWLLLNLKRLTVIVEPFVMEKIV